MSSGTPFTVKFWGVRGGIPTPDTATRDFGGNTPCVEVRCGEHLLIFDAGTGMRPFGLALDQSRPVEGDIFFSESRFDHACGLPFFGPGYNPNNSFTVWAGHLPDGRGIQTELNEMMTSPLFPIPLHFIGGLKTFSDFSAGDRLTPRPGITITTARLKNPNGATGYRIEFDGRVLAYIGNTAHEPGKASEAVIGLMRDADLAIYDSFYNDDELSSGARALAHSTWQEGTRLLKASGAKALATFQHHPNHDDAQLRDEQAALEKIAPGSVVAYEGLELSL